ncbi:glycoside hydrolase family 127 protein [Olivibacter sitiensis]|uniref:glycoside hydrolase family 127 protein n=1 Tax=Olivibacter sitiensis TaxID=376470 RepID=UPI0012F70F1C|nr:glycoside hydrolase family 127 protein [Olivibacter sitiensis]
MIRYKSLFYNILLAIVLIAACKKQKDVRLVHAFPLSDIKLLDGPFKHATDLGKETLLNYEPDRLLSKFRKNSGLEPKAESYKGWEDGSLAGHSLGHYLSAISLMYQTTGDRRFLDRANYIVSELDSCQQVSGSGYLGAYDKAKLIFEEQIAKGEIESQGFDLNGLWAPFYVQHKIMAGLRDTYHLLGNQQALTVEKRFADWTQNILSLLTEDQLQEMLHCEHGGMNEVLVDLYTDTEEDKYLQLADKFYHKAVLDPLANRQDSLSGLHANTQIPKVIGIAKRYEATGDVRDSIIVAYFWDRVVNHHSYVTGGNANFEYFGHPDHLSKRLSDKTTETCNVYNMLKLSDIFFQWNPDAKMADYYERALFNQILSSQHPESGNVIYNLSLEMGGHKHYQNPFGFTCCVGTGMENHAKYAAHIYYYNENELYVNQFIASELNWKEKGLKLVQNTQFPNEQNTNLLVYTEKPTKLTIKIRYPYWAEKGMVVSVNGEKINVESKAESYVSVTRKWNNEDQISVDFPFTLRLEAMPDDSKRIAMLYGPLVLAGDLGPSDDPMVNTPDYVPVLFTENRDPKVWTRPTGETNTFALYEVGKPRDVILKPFYTTHDRNYSVYFDMFTQAEWEAQRVAYEKETEAKRLLESITYDFVQPGEMQPERDHNFQGEGTHTTSQQGQKARQAERGGWFSFDMKVSGEEPMALAVDYWGGYTGSKTFDILIDDVKVATENISGKKDGAFLTEKYAIPAGLLQGKKKITVKFHPHKGHRAGPVFGLRTIRSINLNEKGS